jgi:hypothetical protein
MKIHLVVTLSGVLLLIPAISICAPEDVYSPNSFLKRTERVLPPEEMELALHLKKISISIYAQAREISEKSFKGRNDISAETAFSLLEEARIVEQSALALNVSAAVITKFTMDESNVSSWTLVIKEMASSYPYIEDLTEKGFIDEKQFIFFLVYVPKIIDRIILPKQYDLIQQIQNPKKP